MASEIKLQAINPQFAVTDLIKTAEYYRDFLGFEILGYWFDPPVYTIVKRDDVELHFGKADTNEAQPSNLKWRAEGLDAYIRITGIQKMYDELKAKGVTILEPVCEREYGMIEFAIADCNGFKIVFGENNS